MARIGQSVQWKAFKRQEKERGEYTELHYALRKDGVMLTKLISGFENTFSGTIRRHDYGWKIYSRNPKPEFIDLLKSKGYTFKREKE